MSENKKLKEEFTSITETNLWKYLENDDRGRDLINEIHRVCYDACVATSTITETFPQFTLHDHTHTKGVLDWMSKLIGDDLTVLTKEEVATLIMIACCHDVGMSLSKDNKKNLLEELESEKHGKDLKEYFHNNEKIKNEYTNRNKEENNDKLYEGIIRDYIRQRHHLRLEEELSDETFEDLTGALNKELIVMLCKSHGEDLSNIMSNISKTGIRLHLLAVLLRLADIINFDTSRTSKIKFNHAGLNNPETFEEIISANEHKKNKICEWVINKDALVCTGKCPDNQIMHDILNYIEWVRSEVESCNKLLDAVNDNPLKIKRVTQDLQSKFEINDFKININAPAIIDLLGSENVYGDNRAFLTELIQNSIDAILVRTNIDFDFKKEDGKIDLYLWEDKDDIYVRIDDNGIGMDREIMKNYFLSVGDSYYNSYEFKNINKGKNKFTPINRFGIGILSCFMNKNVQMEVETKSIKDENVYRMDITSLNGYYSLYKIEKPSESIPVSKPYYDNKINEGYKRDIGTSICIRQKKNDKGISIDSFVEYIDNKVKFPPIEFCLHTLNGTTNFIKEETFCKEVKKLMNGEKYRKIDNVLDVFYLDSLDNYVIGQGLATPNPELLSGVTAVMFNLPSWLFQVAELQKDNKSELTTYENLHYEAFRRFKDWLNENNKKLSSDQKSIMNIIKNDFVKRNGVDIVYNGLAYSCSYHRHLFPYTPPVYFFVNGKWIDRVNLSKTILIGKEEELIALEAIVSQLDYFNSHIYPSFKPIELFDITERFLIENQYIEEKNGIYTYDTERAGFSEIPRLYILGFYYNFHVDVDKNNKHAFKVSYTRKDSFSKEEIELRVNLFNYPIVVINENNTDFRLEGMINFNYPTVKWIMIHYKELLNYNKEMFLIYSDKIRVLDISKEYDHISYFYKYLCDLKAEKCDFIDDEILHFSESRLKDLTNLEKNIEFKFF